MRAIHIDIEVHKRIEAERISFDETPNDVLRRVLGLGVGEPLPPPAVSNQNAAGRPWLGQGVTLPHGSDIRMQYRNTWHSGVIDNGKWLVSGQKFNGPSPAAAAVAVTKSGTKPSLNGWIYWHVRFPGTTKWIPIDSLRKP